LLITVGSLHVQDMLRTKTEVTMNLTNSASDQKRRDFYAAVRQLPFVNDVTYQTREQHLEYARVRHPSLVRFLETNDLRNPYSDTLTLNLQSSRDIQEIVVFAKGDRWRDIVDPISFAEISLLTQERTSLIATLRTLTQTSAILLVLTVFALLFVLGWAQRSQEASAWKLQELLGMQMKDLWLTQTCEGVCLLLPPLLVSGLLLWVPLLLPQYLLPPLLFSGAFAKVFGSLLTTLTVIFPMLLALELVITPLLAALSAWGALLSAHMLSLPRFSLPFLAPHNAS
jgi:hypothetical protein